MKVVINVEYGGFALPDEFMEMYPNEFSSCYDYSKEIRQDERLINYLENLSEEEIDTSDLQIAYIPDDATDWRIEEYDGAETLYYVLNGKICEANIYDEF